ncbi:peptidase C1 [Sinorhizobium medicae]|uniref:Peptidase C1A papain n=2 Tax=Sinorhizobium medicae TaxID=110321 RepID=A6UM50_SINMW|nr:C1 family peptidase [Sinorhizobium medicae]ABR64730.1 peptidase C1A papain [Sinorhizobium medicae WSM419]MDX0408964.1 peptidase C1 [Sinorhizobium medicae]MDX0415138.1 peptidase C1 [Sinorhizobium medicae]MDX0420964.1 peptidase C1 [Sinorhizobium medicae]MDX0427177.1 peptidase C1 [Sinorhizobium medicae]
MQPTMPFYNFLPEDFKVYVGADGGVSYMPGPQRQERTLPTINRYGGPDGGYVAVCSRVADHAVYSVGDGIYVVGQIRLQGAYEGRFFVPKGYGGKCISAAPDIKAICDQAFPGSAPNWASGDAGGWFGLLIDKRDVRDKILTLDLPQQLPEKVDLRRWCSQVQNQGTLNACTAYAASAILEYFENRAGGNAVSLSEIFLYKVTRNLMHKTGDTGANTRSVMKALAALGTVPEEYWPDDASQFDAEPSAFAYALAGRYRSLKYSRIDAKDRSKDVVLRQAKTLLSRNRPVMFGVMAYFGTWQQFVTSDRLPYPSEDDTLFGAHNIAVMGYDDGITTENAKNPGIKTRGAFLIKNSYGEEWGDKGYGWIPYDYLLKHQSIDWWTITKQEWLDMSVFS